MTGGFDPEPWIILVFWSETDSSRRDQTPPPDVPMGPAPGVPPQNNPGLPPQLGHPIHPQAPDTQMGEPDGPDNNQGPPGPPGPPGAPGATVQEFVMDLDVPCGS